jgi:hypothetical protein
VVGAAADELAADGARRIEVVRLPEQREPRVARAGQGAGVGLLRAGDEPQ